MLSAPNLVHRVQALDFSDFWQISDFLVSKYVWQNYLVLSESCKMTFLERVTGVFRFFTSNSDFFISPPASCLQGCGFKSQWGAGGGGGEILPEPKRHAAMHSFFYIKKN